MNWLKCRKPQLTLINLISFVVIQIDFHVAKVRLSCWLFHTTIDDVNRWMLNWSSAVALVRLTMNHNDEESWNFSLFRISVALLLLPKLHAAYCAKCAAMTNSFAKSKFREKMWIKPWWIEESDCGVPAVLPCKIIINNRNTSGEIRKLTLNRISYTLLAGSGGTYTTFIIIITITGAVVTGVRRGRQR